MRSARVERKTEETAVSIEVNIGTGAEGGITGSSGIGFMDHALEAMSHHGSLELEVEVSGDEDPHHRAEDIAIVLGKVLREAAGPEIERFGDARVPMDDAVASVALDFGGRAYADVVLPGGEVNGLPVSLFEHFVRTLASSSRSTIHLEASGMDTHHVVEAAFKCLGVALERALSKRGSVRSTKGVVD
ncbi:MAG: Imidazoleglycerol-phosphate dehydratase [Methanonatronarchaeales archaeon]|nr:Imidazoleglycerol-phosphate dehydratase [Methanonatronarchaeales archaeon]